MSFLNRLFGKEDDPDSPDQTGSGFEMKDKPSCESLQDLLESHAAFSFEKQISFGELIGDNSWQFDMGSGTISFGDQLSFPVQVIGSVSFNDNSWMWGWANTQSGIPDNLLLQAEKLRVYGEDKGIDALVNGHYTIDEGFEHRMGMIACGVFSCKSYYCANYGQGTLVVTIDDDNIHAVDTSRAERVLTIFPQVISCLDLNHKNSFVNYLIDRDIELKENNNMIEGFKNGKILTAEFDDQERLVSLTGNV